MKFKIYRQYGSLNSGPIFDHLARGIKILGHDIVDHGEDVAVIWSVLWAGRMAGNQQVYKQCLSRNIPVLIIEVGNLKRNQTWRLSLNHINGHGIFADDFDLDIKRPKRLGVSLKDEKINRKSSILIATQHQRSLQWEGMPPMNLWIESTIKKIKSMTDRSIIIRPHPRSPLVKKIQGVTWQMPKKINNTYDDYDIDYDHHLVINHNSGPAVQAAIEGVPVLCDTSSLAYSVSDTWENITNPTLKPRDEWFLKLCHTEWTLDEIASGGPLKRLLLKLS